MANQNTLRRQFGSRLAQLRQARGLTSRGLAPLLGITQGTLSKLENGKHLPSPELLQALARALRLTATQRAELRELASAALTRLHRVQFRHEAAYAQIQKAVTAVDYHDRRVLQLSLIPGPLQTEGYARALFTAVADATSDVDAAVAERLKQAERVEDPARHFQFLIHEAALRTRIGAPRVMARQIERVEAVMDLEHVEVGVLPMSVDYPRLGLEPPQSGFDLFDAELLTVDLNGCWLTVEDRISVRHYSDYFDALWTRAALLGDACHEALQAARQAPRRR